MPRPEPTVEQAETIIDAAADFGAYDLEVYEDYSGRGMFGDKCVAITGDGDDRTLFIAIGVLIGDGTLEPEAADWFARGDQMGRGWVRY